MKGPLLGRQEPGLWKLKCMHFFGSVCVCVYIYIFFFVLMYFFLYFWLQWVFIAARGPSPVSAGEDYSSLQCTGFSLQWLLSLQSTGSRAHGLSTCGSQVLEHRLSSCGTRAQLLHAMWDLPGPGIEAVSPALAGRFLCH